MQFENIGYLTEQTDPKYSTISSSGVQLFQFVLHCFKSLMMSNFHHQNGVTSEFCVVSTIHHGYGKMYIQGNKHRSWKWGYKKPHTL